jgi:hypothetical protein
MKKPTQRLPEFTPAQFTPTQTERDIEKARFANQFVRFVAGGFAPHLFPDWFYTRLSLTFGHIAHYNRRGFYETWFTNPRRQLAFLSHTMQYPCYGDPRFTYSDVETALVKWLETTDYAAHLASLIEADDEAVERATLSRLIAKYGVPEQPNLDAALAQSRAQNLRKAAFEKAA